MNETNGIANRAPLLMTTQVAFEIGRCGARDDPGEAHGALLGVNGSRGREVRALYPLAKGDGGSPRYRFSITPEDFHAAEDAASRQRLELVGWYRAHSGCPARPSHFDLRQAWPWYSYVLVNAEAGKRANLSAWLLSDDHSHFDRQEIRAG